MDSLSLDCRTMRYFVDDEDEDLSGDSVIVGEYRRRVVAFLKKALAL